MWPTTAHSHRGVAAAPRAAHAAATSTCVSHPYPRVAATSEPSSPLLPLCSSPREDSRRALCLAVPPHQVPKQPPRTPVLLEQAQLHPQDARPQTSPEAANTELHLPPRAAHHRRPPSDPLRSSRYNLELPRATSSLSGPKSCTDDPSSTPPLISSPSPTPTTTDSQFR
jgi:hypothetical protein